MITDSDATCTRRRLATVVVDGGRGWNISLGEPAKILTPLSKNSGNPR